MNCTVVAAGVKERQPLFVRLMPLVASMLKRHFRPHYKQLDFEAMPDHMMRDLGFLDGNDPRYEDERWR